MSDSKYRKAHKDSVSRKRGTVALGALTAVFMLWFTLGGKHGGLRSGESATSFPVKTYSANEDDEFVYYFAYASDLLQARISIGCPSAEKIAVASLPGYKFGFTIFSKVWKGGVADIYPTEDGADKVWGVVYKVSREDLRNLDKQKGVGKEDPKYQRISVLVKEESGRAEYVALSYNIVDSKRVPAGSGTGYKKFAPSIQYKSCVVNGAKENDFPPQYIGQLEEIIDNGNSYRRKGVGSACD